MHEYPKWVKVSGPGHPQNPGFVLVENEDQERTAVAEGEGPADLNPPPEDAQKKVADDKPAANVTEQAATPPEHKKGSRKPAGKVD